MINQVLTRWRVPNSAAEVLTVMNFDEDIPVATQRTALADFWESVSGVLHESVTWTVDTSGRILDETTGSLVGVWYDGEVRTGTGQAPGPGTLANATMLLYRWRAPAILGGRRVQGRTFVPGPVSSLSVGGEVSTASLPTLSTYAGELIDAGVGFGIWSRPTDQRSGQFNVANDGDVWREFAVQRKRRA